MKDRYRPLSAALRERIAKLLGMAFLANLPSFRRLSEKQADVLLRRLITKVAMQEGWP
jgi:hypothetical protein